MISPTYFQPCCSASIYISYFKPLFSSHFGNNASGKYYPIYFLYQNPFEKYHGGNHLLPVFKTCYFTSVSKTPSYFLFCKEYEWELYYPYTLPYLYSFWKYQELSWTTFQIILSWSCLITNSQKHLGNWFVNTVVWVNLLSCCDLLEVWSFPMFILVWLYLFVCNVFVWTSMCVWLWISMKFKFFLWTHPSFVPWVFHVFFHFSLWYLEWFMSKDHGSTWF